MDMSSSPTNPSAEEDEWDTDGFEIPSLGIDEPDEHILDSSDIVDSKTNAVQAAKEEKIYLGPHGVPRQEKQNPPTRKQMLKQRIKEADQRYSGTGRENKVDNLRELVGTRKTSAIAPKSSTRDWLDPHCHESEFEKRRLH